MIEQMWILVNDKHCDILNHPLISAVYVLDPNMITLVLCAVITFDLPLYHYFNPQLHAYYNVKLQHYVYIYIIIYIISALCRRKKTFSRILRNKKGKIGDTTKGDEGIPLWQ